MSNVSDTLFNYQYVLPWLYLEVSVNNKSECYAYPLNLHTMITHETEHSGSHQVDYEHQKLLSGSGIHQKCLSSLRWRCVGFSSLRDSPTRKKKPTGPRIHLFLIQSLKPNASWGKWRQRTVPHAKQGSSAGLFYLPQSLKVSWEIYL